MRDSSATPYDGSSGRVVAADLSELRRAIVDALASDRYTVWLNVDLSCDPTWQLP